MFARNPRLVVLVVWLIIMLAHVGGSHALRYLIRRNGWLRLPASKLALRLLASVGLLAVVVELCVTPAAAVAGITSYRQQAALFGLYVIASLVLFSLWTLCYLAVVRYRENEMRSLRLEASLREAELRALKSQVNPHFLFNCLNNVRSLVAEDAGKAREMLLRLSELLRYALEAGVKEKVILDDELHAVEAYLELEKLQFEERLSWRIAADTEGVAGDGAANVRPATGRERGEAWHFAAGGRRRDLDRGNYANAACGTDGGEHWPPGRAAWTGLRTG